MRYIPDLDFLVSWIIGFLAPAPHIEMDVHQVHKVFVPESGAGEKLCVASQSLYFLDFSFY